MNIKGPPCEGVATVSGMDVFHRRRVVHLMDVVRRTEPFLTKFVDDIAGLVDNLESCQWE